MNPPAFLASLFNPSTKAEPKEALRKRFYELEAYCATLPGLPHTTLQAYTSPPLASKNRYRLVLPLSSDRVVLGNHLSLSGTRKHDYINANWIGEKRYIATQAPLPGSFGDFWEMVWGENVKCIVMLVQVQPRKADKYWPGEKGQVENYGTVTVQCISRQSVGDGLWRREFKLQLCADAPSNAAKAVTQFYYERWPDHGPPASFHDFQTLHSTVASDCSYSQSPIIIHCRYFMM